MYETVVRSIFDIGNLREVLKKTEPPLAAVDSFILCSFSEIYYQCV